MAKGVDPCSGCICATCEKSAHNGAIYACATKACKMCNADKQVIKRCYCAGYLAKESHTDDLRL